MAANRGKLSLRRKNKEPVATQPVDARAAQPSTLASDTSGGVAAKKMDLASVGADIRGLGEERRDDLEDFRPQPSGRAGVGKKRRLPQNETAGYLDMVSEDQLQLALAMSASLRPPSSLQAEIPAAPREKKRARHGKGTANERDSLPTNVITTSSAEKQKIIAQRASAILREARLAGRAAVGGEAGTLHPSQLGQRVREGGSSKTSTLWEMAGYAERDTRSKFVVPALDLPASESRSSPSPQHSPAAHPHQTPSPPPLHPHTSRSPQRSPSHSRVSSRSPQRSASSHLFHSSPASPSTPPHPSPRPPSLPRGVQTLLSDLSSLVGSQLCSDVVITVDDGRGIPAHSAILACRCPILAERLFHSLDKPVRLNFSQYSRATVVSFLRYLYTGSIPSGQNGAKAVKMLAMSLGMLEPVEEREEQHPLIQAHTSDSGLRVKGTSSSSISSPHINLGVGSTPYLAVGPRIQTPTPATFSPHTSPLHVGRQATPPPHEAPPTNEATHSPNEPLRKEATPPMNSEVVQMTTADDVISVSSSPPDQPTPPTSPPYQSTSPPPHQSTSPPPHQSTSPPPHQPTSPPPHQPTSPPPHQPTSPPPHQPTSPPSPEEDSQKGTMSTPLPLRARISRPHPSVGVASVPLTETLVQDPSGSPDTSHDQPTGSHDQPTGSHDQPSQQSASHSVPAFITPAAAGQRPVLESDPDITPMPNYPNMDTPHLRGECSKFGVRALPKKKMIAKLTEIYDYTHPLTDEDGNIVSSMELADSAKEEKKKDGGKRRAKKKDSATSCEKPSLEELAAKVREVITNDTQLYEDMLMYKPLELTYIQTRLKAAALSLSREVLMDVLDHLCITFSVPRHPKTT